MSVLTKITILYVKTVRRLPNGHLSMVSLLTWQIHKFDWKYCMGHIYRNTAMFL